MRPSNRLGRLDLAPPTRRTVGVFQTRRHLASPGRLAGGGGSLRKPVWGRKFPVIASTISGHCGRLVGERLRQVERSPRSGDSVHDLGIKDIA
jgi:hypothetical protein